MNARYHEIARILKNEIREGHFAVGDLLPRRADLAERFGVNRATIDRSVRCLAGEGIVDSRPGSGTRILFAKAQCRIAVVRRDRYPPSLPPTRDYSSEMIQYDDIPSRSDRSQLKRFDGVLWFRPTLEHMQWIDELEGVVPQIVVNRPHPTASYVSGDHQHSAKSITSKRLQSNPEARPYLLSLMGDTSYPFLLRQDGFVDACREADRFYEIIRMPESFSERVAILDEKLNSRLDKPLLIVSDSIQNTGSFIAWATKNGLRWKQDVFYNDFDNTQHEYIWGIVVTSLLHDIDSMYTLALSKLVDIIHGKESVVKILIPDRFVEGET